MKTIRYLRRLSDAYQRMKIIKDLIFSKKYLFYTNMGISVGLSGIGDMTQQHYMILKGEKKTWDVARSGHMSITGLTVGAVCHKWYMFLDKKLPGRTIKTVLKKVIVDQIFFSPVCISVFFLTSGLLDRSTLKSIGNEIIEKGKQLYVAEWVVWPPAQLINFLFLPTKYRIFYDSTISFGYDIYTSYVKHDSSGKLQRSECKK